VNQTYRLAEVSANIIDQCVSQGVPLARGRLWTIVLLELVSRTFMQKGKQDNNCFRSLLSNEPSDRSWKNKNAPPSNATCCGGGIV
jgi:hypothetical protein